MPLLQILVEKALIEGIGLEWAGLGACAPDTGTCTAPAAAASHIAVRNHALLTQRMESDLAASRKFYSLTSPGQHLLCTAALLCRSVLCCSCSVSDYAIALEATPQRSKAQQVMSCQLRTVLMHQSLNVLRMGIQCWVYCTGAPISLCAVFVQWGSHAIQAQVSSTHKSVISMCRPNGTADSETQCLCNRTGQLWKPQGSHGHTAPRSVHL